MPDVWINKEKYFHKALEKLPVEYLQSCCTAVAHHYIATAKLIDFKWATNSLVYKKEQTISENEDKSSPGITV